MEEWTRLFAVKSDRRTRGTSVSPHSKLMTLLFVVIGTHAGWVLAQANCGQLQFGFGPWDYRYATEHQRSVVETNHFTTDVEQLRAAITGTIAGDISYTLQALPNHPRALWAMVRLSRKQGAEKPSGAKYGVGCWFDRAIRFAPDDGEVRLLFGLWLAGKGEKNQATELLQSARGLIEADDRLKDNSNILYNLGLGFFDVGRYDDAVDYAKRARELGFPLDGLEKKLRQANKWKD